jgi:aryl-alcohol dehydrogenase-like predicted oxidoreductase
MRVSGIGVGSYRGSLNADDDILQFNAIIDSVLLGANVIDTCRNFRGGRSEQVIQAALRYLIEERGYSRDQILIMSKCGYVRDSIP